MPIYEYKCKQCGKISDFLVSVKEIDNFSPRCRYCKSLEMTKLISNIWISKGPDVNQLTSKAESTLMNTFKGKIPEASRAELKEIAKEAAKRGKRRVEEMMDKK